VSKLAEVASEIVSTYGWAHLRVGQELASSLLGAPPAQRGPGVHEWLEAQLKGLAPRPVLFTEIDLLFEPELHLDVLSLLRHASRTARLAVMWPGSYANDLLAYAVPEHAHYRTWRKPDVPVVAVE
jgi:hypothetical protein